jgi:hypothetical protein
VIGGGLDAIVVLHRVSDRRGARRAVGLASAAAILGSTCRVLVTVRRAPSPPIARGHRIRARHSRGARRRGGGAARLNPCATGSPSARRRSARPGRARRG